MLYLRGMIRRSRRTQQDSFAILQVGGGRWEMGGKLLSIVIFINFFFV